MEPIDDGEHWFKLQKFEVQGDKIIGDAYILPLDVRRTYIFILINMAVLIYTRTRENTTAGKRFFKKLSSYFSFSPAC